MEALGSRDQGKDGFVGGQGRTQQVQAGAGLREREAGARTPVSDSWRDREAEESTLEPAAGLLQFPWRCVHHRPLKE